MNLKKYFIDRSSPYQFLNRTALERYAESTTGLIIEDRSLEIPRILATLTISEYFKKFEGMAFWALLEWQERFPLAQWNHQEGGKMLADRIFATVIAPEPQQSIE